LANILKKDKFALIHTYQEIIDGFRFTPGLLSIAKTPDIKVNVYSPTHSVGEGEGGAALWLAPPHQ